MTLTIKSAYGSSGINMELLAEIVRRLSPEHLELSKCRPIDLARFPEFSIDVKVCQLV